MSGRGRAGEGAAPTGLGNGSPWLQPRARAVGRTRAHDARAPEMRASWHNLLPANLEPEILGARGQPAESQTRLDAFFFLTEELAFYHCSLTHDL